jgi:hypothetical protein
MPKRQPPAVCPSPSPHLPARDDSRDLSTVLALPRLVDLDELSSALKVSYWCARAVVLSGQIPRVSMNGRRGKELRRILVDAVDVRSFIEKSKVHGGVR